jgi:hypothetical protein
MPYYQGSRLPKHIPTASSALATSPVTITPGSQHLANWPVSFGFSILPTDSDHPVQSLYNSNMSTTAGLLTHFDWSVYEFNSGHFVHTIHNRGLPFRIVLAANPLPTAAPYLKNLLLAPLSSPGHQLSLTIFVDQASPPNLPGISFTHIATKAANPPKNSGDLQAHIVIQLCLI